MKGSGESIDGEPSCPNVEEISGLETEANTCGNAGNHEAPSRPGSGCSDSERTALPAFLFRLPWRLPAPSRRRKYWLKALLESDLTGM